MATTLQLRRYNTATIASTTGADGEVLVDSTKKTLVVQDGSTSGGNPLATETFVTSGLASLQTTVSAALVNYTINANLTSTLTAYPTNANLTSTLTGYPTNANLTSTVSTAISNLVGGAPAILDTLGEIATALGNNSSLAVTLTSSIALKATSSDLSYLAWTSVVSRLQSSGYTLTLSSNGALVPGSANIDLGTSSAPFRSLYITNQTFYFGGSAVSIDSSNTFSIVTGSSTSTLVNTVTLNTATSAVQSNITVLLYTQVSSVSSSLTFYVDNQTSSITSSITQQINQVSSTLITYVDNSLSSALTSLGTVSDLNLGSDALIFTGNSTTSLELGTLFTSASIGAGASSILIRNPSFNMGSSILNLTSGSTIFADVSSSGTNIQIPFDLTSQATWVSSWGQIIYSNYGYSPSLGGGSSYLISGYTSGTVNTSATHVIRLSRNAYESQVTLYEGTDFTIAGSSITINPTWTFVYLWQLFETTGTTTSVLLIPVAPNTDTQHSWSGDPVYFNNLDVGYTTSSSTFNGSNPGKLVYTNPNGVQYYEDGTIIYPNGSVQSPGNFNLYTSSGSTNFEFTTSGSILLPSAGQLRNGFPGSYGSSGDGSSWFVTPPSQFGGVASADGEQYIQINNNLDVEITTNYTSSSGNSWYFDQSGRTIFPTGVIHSSSGTGVKFTAGYNKSFQIETTTTSTSKLWNFTAQGNLTLPQGGSVQSPGNFNLYTSSGSTNFQFTSSGNIVLPSGAKLGEFPGAGLVSGLATLAGDQVYLTNTSGSVYIGVEANNIPRITHVDTAKSWTFASSGAIVLPNQMGQIGLDGYTNGMDLYNNNGGTGYVRMNYADESVIWGDAGGAHVQSAGTYTWNFNTDGNLTLPAGGDIKNSSGNSIICNIPCPTSSVPATMTSTGIAGQLAYSSSHVYVCVATNTWRRASLGTF
jgi:hypothetical protein